MESERDDILSAFRQNYSPDSLLKLLLRREAAIQLGQHVRANGTSQETISLLERCFQALRRGIAQGGISDDQAGDDGTLRALEKATATLFRAAIDVASGDGDEKDLAAYPVLLLDQLDTLNFQQLAAILSDICRGVEGAATGSPRLLQLLAKTAGLLLSRGAPDDEAEEDAELEAPAAAGQRAPASAAAKHVDTALHRITHTEWVTERHNFAVQIMEALRDVPMTPQQLHAVILKSLSVCGSCRDLAALPALLRQLMRLAGLGHRALVLRGVLALFDRLETQHRAPDGRGPSQVLQNVEGTALVILADAFKYDNALAQELIKSVRASAVSPSPFCLLLLFTLSRQQKLDSVVMGLLKGLVVSAFEWDATRSRSAWLSSLPQLPRPGGQQLRATLLRAVRCSGVGGEVVVPGILSLGAALMGCCPAGEALTLVKQNDAALLAAQAEAEAEAAARRAQRRQQQQIPPPAPQHPPRPRGPANAAPVNPPGTGCSADLQSGLLGIELLQAAFEAHREARPDVLRLCQQALGGTAGGCGALAAGPAGGCGLGGAGQELALPAVLLLGNLVARHPSLLHEHTPKLKDAVQSFLLLPAPVALGLLLALWPLARTRRELSDYLVMLLRKVMFAREAASRLVAVRGFLFILLQQLRAAVGGNVAEDDEQLLAAAAAAAAAAGPSFSQASCSQSSLSQMQALTSGAGVSLQHELQGFLRRALGQQAAVRAALYDGLSSILLADPGSRDVVLELVVQQLHRYVVEGRAMPPLRYKLLAGSAGGGSDIIGLVEPLPSLLACVRRLVVLCREQLAADAAAGGADDEFPGPVLGLLEDDEADAAGGDVVMVDDEEGGEGQGQGTDAALQGLIRTWDSLARRLLRCEAEHFDLNSSADLNPATPSGAAKQLQAHCLLGAIEVVMEELVGIATGPHGSETASRTGDRLMRAFELHCRLHELARDAKAPGGGGRAKQAATEAAAGSAGDGSGGTHVQDTAPPGGGGGGAAGVAGAAAPAGGKRARDLCPDLVPADTRPPSMSAACLGKLCTGVLRDGLATEAADVEGPDEGPSAHTRLARSPVFQAFVLRSCLNALRSASASTGTALSDALVDFAQRRQMRLEKKEQQSGAGSGLGRGLGGAGADVAAGGAGPRAAGGLEAQWKPLTRPLVLLCQTVLTTWSGATKKAAAPRKAAGAGAAPGAAAAAAAQRREAAASDSLASLAVSCLREVLEAAASQGGLQGVAWVLQGLPIHSQDTQAQVDETELPPEELVAVRMQHFGDMLGRLMGTSSFKEATALVEVVLGVARLLPPDIKRVVSDSCLELMHQEDPKVTHVGLVRALIAAHVTLRGTEDLPALLKIAGHIQEVIGAAGKQTLAETSAPGSIHEGTAQLAAIEVLKLIQGYLAEGQELLDAALKGSGGAAEEAALGNGGGEGGAAAGGSRGGGAAAAGAGRGASATSRSVAALVEALCRRLHAALDVLQTVVQTRLGNPQVLECQVEVLIKAYKLLGLLAKAHIPAKGSAAAAGASFAPSLSRPFHELVGLVHKDLTPPVYDAVNDELAADADAQGGGGEGGAAAPRLSRAKLKRDAKAYSQLVHAMEEWEKHLLALDKAYKAQGVNLMKGAKRSVNRDFQFTGPAGGGAAARSAEDRSDRRRRGGDAD